MLLLLSLNNCFENYESSSSSYLFSHSLAELPFRYKQTHKHTYTHISVNGYTIAFIMVIQILEHLEHAGGRRFPPSLLPIDQNSDEKEILLSP